MKQFILMAVILLGMTACNQQKTEIMEEKKEPVLGLGEPISDNFTGEAWLRMLSAQPEYDCSIYNVTFAPDSRFTHIGITPKASENKVEWLGEVTDQEYEQATAN